MQKITITEPPSSLQGVSEGDAPPSDKVFRAFLADADNVRDVVQRHLCAGLEGACDFRTARLEPVCFAGGEGLRPFFREALYRFHTRDGGARYLHGIIGHRSAAERHRSSLFLQFSVAAMQHHLSAGGTTLPLVIPVLFLAGLRGEYAQLTRQCNAGAVSWLQGDRLPLAGVTVIPVDQYGAGPSLITHREEVDGSPP